MGYQIGVVHEMNHNREKFLRELSSTQLAIIRAKNSALKMYQNSLITLGKVHVDHYSPCIEPLKPPKYSGKVEDWINFCCSWQDLMSDIPQNIQIYHLRESLPESIATRVRGLKSIQEIWNRLDQLLGSVELQVTVLTSKLQNLVIKSIDSHEKVIELYEEVEYAVSQLEKN